MVDPREVVLPWGPEVGIGSEVIYAVRACHGARDSRGIGYVALNKLDGLAVQVAALAGEPQVEDPYPFTACAENLHEVPTDKAATPGHERKAHAYTLLCPADPIWRDVSQNKPHRRVVAAVTSALDLGSYVRAAPPQG
jgi:hypothetical protein